MLIQIVSDCSAASGSHAAVVLELVRWVCVSIHACVLFSIPILGELVLWLGHIPMLVKAASHGDVVLYTRTILAKNNYNMNHNMTYHECANTCSVT